MNGKGMRPRLGYNHDKYTVNYDRIFKPNEQTKIKKRTPKSSRAKATDSLQRVYQSTNRRDI